MTAGIALRDPVLLKLEAARQYLAEATDLAEVKNVADVAASAEVYARRRELGEEAIGFAHRVKIDALTRLGELLKAVPKNPGTRTRGGGSGAGGAVAEPPATPTLRDYGIDKKVSAVAQQLASMQPETREAIASGEQTITQARRAIKEDARQERRDDNARAINQAPSLASAIGTARFSTIVVDPPWDWGDEGDQDQLGRARPQYQTMSIEQLTALPIQALSDTDAHLYLWITNRSLPKGFALLEEWGYRYITCLTWCKPSFGMGNYFRGQTEQVLFGVRGSQALKRHDVGTWFQAPRGPLGHSSKPLAFYDLVESCSPGPYLDMFARTARTGWSVWGGEVNAA